MTRTEALTKAEQRSTTRRDDQLVILRTDHPMVRGDYFYVIGADEKRLWTPGESSIAVFRDGERLS